MDLAQALRLGTTPCLALVGAGGKTTALFQLARTLSGVERLPVIVSATTHLHVDQICLADSHWICMIPGDLSPLNGNLQGVVLITGPVDGDRTLGLNENAMDRLRAICLRHGLPLLIEADGSHQHPLKAPAEHEPVIPEFVDSVIIVAGMTGLGLPLNSENIHRPEIFARLSGLMRGEIVSPEALTRFLTHPEGGLKNIPVGARRVVLLNQADTPLLQAQAKAIGAQLTASYHSIIVASLDHQPANLNHQSTIHAIHELVAGIILAAGEAKRFGQPKQLLEWHGQPFVRLVAETALAAGLFPVVVVTGANAEAVESVIQDLPLTVHLNPGWKAGVSASIRTGLCALPSETGAAIFLLADQPQVTTTVLRALVENHSLGLEPIIAPQILGQRANPVLFDKVTFPDLLSLTGDVGGRAIFSKFPVTYLPWVDENLLADIDTLEDYRRLVDGA